MFTSWKWLIVYCLLLICVLTGIAKQQTDQPQPPTTTTTTTIEWNEENLNNLIEQVAREENFEDIFLLKELAEIESQYLKYPEIVEHTGWYSRGLLHFRTSTLIEQGEKYGVIPKGTTIKEGLVLTYNPELQLRIICRMGNDNREFIRQHWWNSWNKIYDL